MTAPVYSSVTAAQGYIDILWDQTVVAPAGRPGEGFTVTVNGATRYVVSASQPLVTTVRIVPAGIIQSGDTVVVSYSNSLSNLQNAGLENCTNFSSVTATNTSLHAALLSSVLGLNTTDNNVITLTFNKTVTSAAFATGLVVKANTAVVTPSTVTAGSDPRTIKITFAGGFQYNDALTWSYTPGDWNSGVAITAYTDVVVTNASRIGTPADAYPLSSVIREQLSPLASVINASVVLDLNSVDQLIVDQYGPLNVDFGGTFGVTIANPSGVLIPQDIQPLESGMRVTKSFTVVGHTDWAAVAATDWLSAITTRISQALSSGRVIDQSTVLGTRTVRQV